MTDILGGLALLGNMISNKLSTQNDSNIDDKKRSDSKIGENIYNSNRLHDVRAKMQTLADSKWNDAKNPNKTKIIPKYYNRTKQNDEDSTFSDNGSESEVASVVSDGTPLYVKGDAITNKNRDVEQFLDLQRAHKKNNGGGKDTFLNQFTPMAFNNPSDPAAQNKIPEQVGNISRLSLERNLCADEGFSNCGDKMTYGVIPENQLTHNNMQPDFRPKKGYGANVDEHKHIHDVSQRKLDLFTGSLNNLDYRPKTERKPLFNPMIGLTHIYGTPVMTSEYESRFIPSRERRNEKPF